MVEPIDRLFQELNRMGAAVLVATIGCDGDPRQPEEVIAECTSHCRDSGRLTWVVLDWLLRHVDELDEDKLLDATRACGDLAVLGALCDAANERNPNPRFVRLMNACIPHPTLVPFFHRVARSPLALRLTEQGALDVFRRWNFLCNELRYLDGQLAGRRRNSDEEVSRGAPPGARPFADDTAYSEDGVDLTLIRWMLSLTPAERLRTLQNTVRSLLKLRGLKMRDPRLPNDRFEP